MASRGSAILRVSSSSVHNRHKAQTAIAPRRACSFRKASQLESAARETWRSNLNIREKEFKIYSMEVIVRGKKSFGG